MVAKVHLALNFLLTTKNLDWCPVCVSSALFSSKLRIAPKTPQLVPTS